MEDWARLAVAALLGAAFSGLLAIATHYTQRVRATERQLRELRRRLDQRDEELRSVRGEMESVVNGAAARLEARMESERAAAAKSADDPTMISVPMDLDFLRALLRTVRDRG